jgi:hypothetical protein
MDYQVPITCPQLAEWFMRIQALADAHHGQATGTHLKALAGEIHATVPSEWWATQPPPLDNRVRN